MDEGELTLYENKDKTVLQTPGVKMVESELALSQPRLQESVKFRFVDSNLNLRTGQSHVLNRQLKP